MTHDISELLTDCEQLVLYTRLMLRGVRRMRDGLTETFLHIPEMRPYGGRLFHSSSYFPMAKKYSDDLSRTREMLSSFFLYKDIVDVIMPYVNGYAIFVQKMRKLMIMMACRRACYDFHRMKKHTNMLKMFFADVAFERINHEVGDDFIGDSLFGN